MEMLDGRYRLEDEIAQGAIGVVRSARDTTSGHPVAVKLLHPQAATQPELAAGFIAEAELLAEVSHPNIIRLVDFVDTGVQYAVVTELVEGEDLRRRVRRDGPLPPAVAVDLVVQAAEALAYLHGRGIVHGDVKPANLLIPADGGSVRLADFGAARRVAGDGRQRAIQATPEYAAPEVVAGCLPTPAADVYALGLVLFELLSGRSPFRGGPAEQVLGRHGRCVPVPPPGLPPVLWPPIEECVAVRPAGRPGAATLAERLRRVAPALDGVPALPPSPPDQITWWPRPAGATTAVVKVSWVPLRAGPASPAMAYASRMVAIPIADVPGGNSGPAASGRRVLPAPPSPAPVIPPSAARSTPVRPPPAVLRPVRPGPGRPRPLLAAGLLAAGLLAAGLVAAGLAVTGAVLGNAGGPGPAPASAGGDPAPGPSVAPSGAPYGGPPERTASPPPPGTLAPQPRTSTTTPAPGSGLLPGIGDPMPDHGSGWRLPERPAPPARPSPRAGVEFVGE